MSVITHFSSFEELIDAIKEDKISKDITSRRYPLRLILLDSFDSFRKLVRELSINLGVSVYNLEDMLTGDDLWITSDALERRV